MKRFRFSENEKEVNQNHLETHILLFYGCSTKTRNISNQFTSETFQFFSFKTAQMIKPELKYFTWPKAKHLSCTRS
jgi:hypothetical protein